MVGLADDVDKARSVFVSDTLPPLCQEFASWLNHGLLVVEYGLTDHCFEFNLDEKLMGDDRLKAFVSATGRPVMLTNEARARLNLAPVDGGDELVTPQNVLVGDNPKPSVDIMAPQDPNGPEQDGSYREAALVKAYDPADPVVQLVPRRAADLDRQLRYIDEASAAVERHFGRLERSLRDKKAAPDWKRWDRELAADLERLVDSIVEREGGVYVARLGGPDFDMRRVENYLKAMAAGAAQGINRVTRDDIRDLGLDEAFGRRGSRVESAGAGIGAGATRFAREEAAKQAPNPERRMKTWVAHTARHAQFDGQTVPLGASWPAGFAPGAAPNCRCTSLIE
jgi:hypothetical protein